MGRDIDLWDATLGPLLSTSLALSRGEWRPPSATQRARQLASKLKHARPPQPLKSADVVTVVANTTHLPPCVAIADELQRRGARCHHVVMGDVVAASLLALGVPHSSITLLHPSLADLGLAKMMSAAIKRAVMAAGTRMSLDPTMATALSLTIIEQLAMHVATARVLTSLRQQGARHLLLGNDLTVPGRMAALMARTCGWSSSSPMHGVVAGEPLQGLHVCDQVLCWGARSAQDMVTEGESPARVVVVGAPGRTQETVSTQLHPAIDAWLGDRPKRPVVLVALSGPGHSVSIDHHRDTLASLVSLASAVDVDVVVKLHPKDNVEHYRRAMAGQSGRFHLSCDLPASPPFRDWMAGIAMVITTTSASGADAILAGLPVVCVDLHGDAADQDYLRAGAVHHATTTAELIDTVKSLLAHGPSPVVIAATHDYVAASFAAFGNVAAARAADVIEASGHLVTRAPKAD
jgi:hypothetical protein